MGVSGGHTPILSPTSTGKRGTTAKPANQIVIIAYTKMLGTHMENLIGVKSAWSFRTMLQMKNFVKNAENQEHRKHGPSRKSGLEDLYER